MFQSEAAVLEHIEAFVFTAPAESGGGGHRPDVVSMDGSGCEMGELGNDLPLGIPVDLENDAKRHSGIVQIIDPSHVMGH